MEGPRQPCQGQSRHRCHHPHQLQASRAAARGRGGAALRLPCRAGGGLHRPLRVLRGRQARGPPAGPGRPVPGGAPGPAVRACRPGAARARGGGGHGGGPAPARRAGGERHAVRRRHGRAGALPRSPAPRRAGGAGGGGRRTGRARRRVHAAAARAARHLRRGAAGAALHALLRRAAAPLAAAHLHRAGAERGAPGRAPRRAARVLGADLPGHATVGAAVGMSQPAAAPALGANPGPAAPLGHAHATSAAVVTALENFARRFMHRFPDNPNARACLALMLRRRSVGDGSLAVPQATRRDLERLLADALRDPARLTCATAWKALAELQYENRGYEAAADTALRGLHWLQARREAGHEALTQVALALRLAMAKSLRRLGRLDEAERHFSVLAGWVTEGETAFAEMSGATPVSIHQQALRGMALVALARGDEHAAKAQYERILGKAAMGRGPGEHWAHADYGWLLYKDGDLQGARQHLEDAVRVALGPESYVTDSQLGEHYQRLGEVYWAMRGRYRREKQFAYHQFLEAAKAEGHSQAPALAGLGRYFLEVEHSPEQASRCFKRALALDPTLELPGGAVVEE
ncbi:THK3 [Auxenochlorella protothecoides x Auxenochlorella symbiontica]